MNNIDGIIEAIEAAIEFDEKIGFGPRVVVAGDAYVRAKDIPEVLRRLARSNIGKAEKDE